jgi:hypothetical protein
LNFGGKTNGNFTPLLINLLAKFPSNLPEITNSKKGAKFPKRSQFPTKSEIMKEVLFLSHLFDLQSLM